MEQLLKPILENQNIILTKLANLQNKKSQNDSQFDLQLFNTNEVYNTLQLETMKKRVHLHSIVFVNSFYGLFQFHFMIRWSFSIYFTFCEISFLCHLRIF